MSGLADLGFAQPLALLALLALAPVVAALWYGAARRREADAAYGGSAQLRRVVSRRRELIGRALLLAAVVAVAVAVARPQWGHEQRTLSRSGIDIVIALDVSRSMTATDADPSRAVAAARSLDTMLSHLRGDRVGLVIFGGSAFERSPLTLDAGAVSQLVERAQGDAPLVARGTDVRAALEAAMDALNVDDPAQQQVVLLVSDGEALEGGDRLEFALQRARDKGVRIYTAAVGTDAGAVLTEGGPGFDFTRTDREALAAIAAATGGEFRELETLAGLAVDFRRFGSSLFDEGEARVPVERFQWFLGAALAMLLLQGLLASAIRTPALTAGRLTLGGTMLGLLPVLLVACGTPLYGHVNAGNEAYAELRFDDALIEYRAAAELDPRSASAAYNTGTTLHRLRRFEEAAGTSEQALELARSAAGEDAAASALIPWIRYSIGSHAFRRGELERARDAFIDVLLDSPGDMDAKANLEIVLRALAPPPPPDDPSGDGDEPAAGGRSGEPGVPGPEPGDGGSSGQGGDGSDGSVSSGDAPGAPAGGPPEEGAGVEQGETLTLEQAQALLAAALAALDGEITAEQAAEVLELARRANALEPLRATQSGPVGRLDR